MKKVMLIITLVSMSFTSCVSKKKFTELEAKNKEIQDLLNLKFFVSKIVENTICGSTIFFTKLTLEKKYNF